MDYSREKENSVRFTPAVPKYKNGSLGQYRLEFSSEENLSWESRESDSDLSPKTSGECQKVLQCVPNNSCVVRKCSAVLITAQNTLQSSHRAGSKTYHFCKIFQNRALNLRSALRCWRSLHKIIKNEIYARLESVLSTMEHFLTTRELFGTHCNTFWHSPEVLEDRSGSDSRLSQLRFSSELNESRYWPSGPFGHLGTAGAKRTEFSFSLE